MVAKDSGSKEILERRLGVKINKQLYKEARQHADDPNLGPGKLCYTHVHVLIPVHVVI
jgi:hypothetical protein